MKKIVIALFALSITFFAVIKGSLWYFTQQFVDNQIIQAKPFAQISYKELKTSLTGSAKVNGIKIFIPLADETIHIESIQFTAPDLITFLTLDSTLQQKRLPESLTIAVSGAALDLNGNIMNAMDNPNAAPSLLEVFATLACGDVYRIGSKALSKMGYDKIINDTVLTYDFHSQKKILNYRIKNHIRYMTQFNLSGELHNVRDFDSFSNNTVKPAKISLEIIDDSYIERKNTFCANQGKREVDEYINEHTLQVKEYLTSYGVKVEEGLMNAYKSLLEKPDSLVFEADLSQLTGLEELKTFAPNDIIQFVHLKLFVNKKRINEISIEIDKEKLIQTTTSDEIDLETPEQIQKKQAIIIKKYRPISVAALQKYNGHRVKIETNKGKQYRGSINTADPLVYEVITRLRSGNISYHIPIENIKKAEIFY